MPTNRRSNDFKAYGTNRYETYYSKFIRIDTTNDIRFGHDMFSNEYTGFVVLRDGSFITDKYAYKTILSMTA